MKILVVGSINMDLVTYVNSLPQRGETTFGSTFMQNPGGKGANQACAAALLNGDVTFLGAIGSDDYGKSLQSCLCKCGVKPVLKISKTKPTGCASIIIEEDVHDNRIIVISGANEEIKEHDIDMHLDLLQDADIIIMQLEIPLETVEYVATLAHKMHKTVILNPAPGKKLSDNLLTKVDYLTPNETELALLTDLEVNDEESLAKACDCLLNKGTKNLLITLGSKGVYWCTQDAKKLIPAFRVDAIDTTAAGDCFNGAFATFLSEGYEVEKAILYAQKASSICVQRKGAIASLPRREELMIKN